VSPITIINAVAMAIDVAAKAKALIPKVVSLFSKPKQKADVVQSAAIGTASGVAARESGIATHRAMSKLRANPRKE
jgi:hypothetical protein